MKEKITYYEITDNCPDDWEQSNNGGDYHEYRRLHTMQNGKYFVSYHSSYDGEYCNLCGDYHAMTEDCCPHIEDSLPENGGVWEERVIDSEHWMMLLINYAKKEIKK